MSEWGDRTLEDLLVLYDSGTWGQPAIQQQGLPVLRSTNIQGWELTLKTDLAYRTVSERDMERRKLEKGDIIVTKSSGSSHLIGEAALFNLDDSQGHYLFSNFTLRLRPNQALILPKYLHYYLRSPKARLVIANMHRTTSGLRNLQMTEYLSQPVVMPFQDEPERSLVEQQRIVARIEALLAEVREMRALHDEITADANKLIDAVLTETFAPKEWEKWPNKAALGDLAEITARQVNPTLPAYRDMPHIYGATIEEGTGKLLEYNTAAEDGMTSGKYHFKAGAVLYSKIRPYLRKVTIADFDGLCSADMYPLRLKTDDILPEFLMWSLLSPVFTNYANSLSGRARIPKLNRTQLFSYEMPYPGRALQKVICERLRYVREEIREMQTINNHDSELLDQLEQAILAQAFRGEL